MLVCFYTPFRARRPVPKRRAFAEGRSTAGKGREEGDLIAVFNGGVPLDDFAVDGGLDDVSNQNTKTLN